MLGYYASDDEWVLRKHAQMLSNAGVDVVIFGNANAVNYDGLRNTLCRIWSEMRRKGGKTPQIAFHCPFGNPNGIGTQTLNELYETLYMPARYRDLWFLWNGRALVFADPSYADANILMLPAKRITDADISRKHSWSRVHRKTSVNGDAASDDRFNYRATLQSNPP